MPHRIKTSQERHDEKVRAVALRLRRAGYFVRADLPGHPRPPSVGRHVPDIYAHKKGKKVFYEIETKASLRADREQRRAFARAAAKTGAELRVLVA